MVTEKQIIEKLEKQKSNYTSPESAQDQAYSLESLSTDIYTDSKRFIFELLQNADDASSNSGKLEVLIKIVGNYLTVSHQGEVFSDIDVESICSVGDGNKQGDENKTGFKGIGFKSVFSHSDYVAINSGNYCFRFDKYHWLEYWGNSWGNKESWKAKRECKGKEDSVKMPWQIIPIWTNLEQHFTYLEKFKVSTIIRYADTSKLEKELFELFLNTQILLFLRSQNVKITISGKDTIIIEKVKQEETLKLKQNGKVLSEWLLKSFTFDVDSSTRNLIANDVRIPKKLRQISKTEISFAVQVENGGLKNTDKENRLIFTYLPTSVNLDFPFLVNASFLTDAGRQHIHDDWEWNKWLFKQIPIRLFEWLAELSRTKFKNEILRLVPQKFVSHSELKQSFNHGFDEAIIKTAFLLSKQGELLRTSEVILDKTNITDFIDSELLIDFINFNKNRNYQSNSLIFEYKPTSTLNRLGVEIFDIDNLDSFFNSNLFKKKHKRKENFALINFLYEQVERYPKRNEKKSWNYKLSTTPFIFDEKKKLKSPKEIYFPSIEFENNFSEDISLIHPKTINEIESNHQIKHWLGYLGVEEPSDISFIEKTIIANSNFITEDNAIDVGKYLFTAHKKGQLVNFYNDLKTIKVITKENSLIGADDAYLADFYNPELKLEPLYKNDFYVSEMYFSDNDLISEWNTFFVRIGIKSKITIDKIKLTPKEANSKYHRFVEFFNKYNKQDYVSFAGGKFKNSIALYEFYIPTLIEEATNFIFARHFWKNIFSLKFEKNYKDTGYAINEWHNSPILKENLFEWIVKTMEVIPTSQGKNLKCNEVFINTAENIEIGGKYLPIFDYKETIPEDWLNFLPFKTSFELDDYLKILTALWKDADIVVEFSSENKELITQIYQRIAKNYLGYEDRLKAWSTSNKLISKDGKTFLCPTELVVVTIEGFKGSNLAHCDEKNEKVIKLLEIFGVTIIDKVKPYISNSQTEIKDLKRQLNHILPLIAVVSVEKSKSKKEWITEFNRLISKLVNIRFLETIEIWLSYGNEADKQKRSSWVKGNDFYYVGNWYKPRVLDSLIEPIGIFLGIRYAERHLYVLLSDSFREGIEYIKETYGEDAINLIPEELLNPKELEILSQRTGGGYTEIKADLGRKGELFVFNQLKKIYQHKYGFELIETDSGFNIGNSLDVVWENIGGIESGKKYDFLITEDGKKIYIESKATPFGEYTENVEFELTINEYRLMESADRYLVARVFNVTTNPSIKFIKMDIDELIEN